MELIKQHILPCLKSFMNEALSSMDSIVSEIQNDSNEKLCKDYENH